MKAIETYKGYDILKTNSDRYFVKLNGETITIVVGSLGCARFYVDETLEDLTPVDPYEGLDIAQTTGEPTNEELNEMDGVKCCPFMKLLDETKDQQSKEKPFVSLTDEEKNAYYNAYHEGYQQAMREVSHIVNP